MSLFLGFQDGQIFPVAAIIIEQPAETNTETINGRGTIRISGGPQRKPASQLLSESGIVEGEACGQGLLPAGTKALDTGLAPRKMGEQCRLPTPPVAIIPRRRQGDHNPGRRASDGQHRQRGRRGAPADWVVDLESFTRWADSDDVPEKARIWFLDGEVWVDMSKEQVFSHVLVKTKLTVVLGSLVETDRRGLYLGDGVRVRNVEADFSVKPDGVFVAQPTLAAGRVRLVEGMEEGFLELEERRTWSWRWSVPVRSRRIRCCRARAYANAGIPEYWLVDARKKPLSFDILKHRPRGYVAAHKQDGWMKSAVFGRSFRLVPHDHPGASRLHARRRERPPNQRELEFERRTVKEDTAGVLLGAHRRRQVEAELSVARGTFTSHKPM